MTTEQIHNLLTHGILPEATGRRQLAETHISWVILCSRFVYKIKKPLHYSFLDFSTLEKRRFFCNREIELNKRLTEDVYLDVQPVKINQGRFFIGNDEGPIVDYAVRMRKMDPEKQMDKLLEKNKAGSADMQRLAEKIARFHARADIIYPVNFMEIQQQFNDLQSEKEFLARNLYNSGPVIANAIEWSNAFLHNHKKRLNDRLQKGFIRDVHGDLHAKNIFLLPAPQPFDCIEFNDDFRKIDVLNEVAFLCMDLDAFGREDLANQFLQYYNSYFPALETTEDEELFIYYKSYRANIRAKVNSLRSKSAANKTERQKALTAADKYLRLMNDYVKSINKGIC